MPQQHLRAVLGRIDEATEILLGLRRLPGLHGTILGFLDGMDNVTEPNRVQAFARRAEAAILDPDLDPDLDAEGNAFRFRAVAITARRAFGGELARGRPATKQRTRTA